MSAGEGRCQMRNAVVDRCRVCQVTGDASARCGTLPGMGEAGTHAGRLLGVLAGEGEARRWREESVGAL